VVFTLQLEQLWILKVLPRNKKMYLTKMLTKRKCFIVEANEFNYPSVD